MPKTWLIFTSRWANGTDADGIAQNTNVIPANAMLIEKSISRRNRAERVTFVCSAMLLGGTAVLSHIDTMPRVGSARTWTRAKVTDVISPLHSSYERGCQAKTLLHSSP